MSDWEGTTIESGRYKVLRKLARGGYGDVFLGHDTRLDQEVVLKVPRLSWLEEPDFAERYRREIRAMVKLRHPHTVTVLDEGEHDGRPFAVFQYLAGGTLSDRMQQHDQSPLETLADWLPQIASALDFMHRQGYVHRDVKPSNILFDTEGHPYVADFGIAKVVAGTSGSTLTGTGLAMGTPEYMAPEVCRGEVPDSRADQYALAVTVYEYLSGDCPIRGSTPVATMHLQTQEAPPPLSQAASVPDELSEIVGRGLHKDPGKRFADCTSFATAVVNAVSATTPAPAATSRQSVQRPGAIASAALELPTVDEPDVSPDVDHPDDTAGHPISEDTGRQPVVEDDQPVLPPPFVDPVTKEVVADSPRGPRTSRQKRDRSRSLLNAIACFAAVVMAGVLVIPAVIIVLDANGIFGVDSSGEWYVDEPETESAAEVGPAGFGLRARAEHEPPLLLAPFSTAEARGKQQEWADGFEMPITVQNSIGMRLSLIPGGEFQMGSSLPVLSWSRKHLVRVTQPFYLSIYEITQQDYERITGHNPSCFSPTGSEESDREAVSGIDTSRFPVENVTWFDAAHFCNKLSEREGLSPYYVLSDIEREDGAIVRAVVQYNDWREGYRLPTEAEWEYACRAGTTTPFHFGSTNDGTQSNFGKVRRTVEIGNYRPNSFGLFDMHGNVAEWCADWFEENYSTTSSSDDPEGPPTGSMRVLRGGNWTWGIPEYTSSGHRSMDRPGVRSKRTGFRVAVSLYSS